MRKDVDINKKIIGCVVILGVMFVISCILLMILVALLFKWGLTEGQMAIAIIGIYIITTFIGGILIGKYNKAKKYIWGLIIGLSYYVVLMIVTLIANKGLVDYNIVTTMILCLCSGMLGGMFS